MRSRTVLKQAALLCLAGCLALTATACARRSKAPAMARTDVEALVAGKAPVNILDHDLRNKVAADIVDAQRLEDGRLRIRVQLRNSTRKDLPVEVRTVFKDEMGLSNSDETEWQSIFFAPQQMMTIAAESRLADPKTFTIEVRKP